MLSSSGSFQRFWVCNYVFSGDWLGEREREMDCITGLPMLGACVITVMNMSNDNQLSLFDPLCVPSPSDRQNQGFAKAAPRSVHESINPPLCEKRVMGII